MKQLHKLRLVFWVIPILFLAACNPDREKTFQQLISVKADTLKIDNTKDTLIFGSKGTALFFAKESFQLADGTTPKGNISIFLKECYSNSDIIKENLATTADGKLLETRGMINVTAFSNKEELKLKKGKKFIIHFPKDSSDRQKQMNLFYGNSNATGTTDWKLDSVTLLKPKAYMDGYGWSTTGYVRGDTSKNSSPGFYFKGQKTNNVFNYFYKNFDNTKLKQVKGNLLGTSYEAKFIVTKQGKIRDVKITAEVYDGLQRKKSTKTKADPYFTKFIEQIPQLEPFYNYDENNRLKPSDIDASFHFLMGLSPPDYRDNDGYNKVFNKKYNAFKKSAIASMNEAELNYYIFSSAKLGWINCDFFWQVPDEKIDYYVKTDAALKPNIKLVFKQAKSILSGTLVGDRYVFSNVPVNQEIKIVAIIFKTDKPLMAVAETTTGKQVFEKLNYKTFTISDLEAEVNTP